MCGSVFLERGAMIVREPVDPLIRRHVAESRAPERQRVEQRFAQNDFFRGLQIWSYTLVQSLYGCYAVRRLTNSIFYNLFTIFTHFPIAYRRKWP